MATGGVTSGMGDIIYQQVIEKRGWRDHELFRTRRLAVYGCFCFAPVANRWHAVLNSIKVGGKWSTVAARSLTDSLIFAPFATCFFYLCQGTMEGRPWTSTTDTVGIYERLNERLFGTVLKQWAFFGPAQIINLTLIPVYARPPFINCFALGWNIYLAGAQNTGAINPSSSAVSIGDESRGVVAVEIMQ